MADFTVTTTTFGPVDRSWLLFEADGVTGQVGRTQGALDLALFTAGTHYPSGYMPSGLVLGRVTASGLLGPYSNTATDGRETAAGILFDDVSVPSVLTHRITVALVDCYAVISEARLPTGHGLDAAAKADLPLIKFRAV